jgi:hypothetical protein
MASSLEDFPTPPAGTEHARASQLVAAGEVKGLRANIWMGGSHSHVGELVSDAPLENSWIIDCAGVMPTWYREQVGRWVACVFEDVESRPSRLWHIEEVVKATAEAVSIEAGPSDVIIVCQHGMNRSGLMSGLLLRALGFEGEAAVSRIKERRPGALSNLTFRGILLRGV